MLRCCVSLHLHSAFWAWSCCAHPPAPPCAGRPHTTMDGLSLVPLLVFGCLGELGKLNLSHSALHPLRRRANSARKDAPRFPTSPTPASAPGALLLSSYLLVHLLIPRMRPTTIAMDSSTENPVCLHCDQTMRQDQGGDKNETKAIQC
jgi:hypothetical protein